jgi:uncharacterized protein YdeI (YjbR/CyaY-like superfamily)
VETGETLYNATRQEFRRRLQQDDADRIEVWLIQHMKATGRPSLNYVEAVEEAICLGGIDNFEKSMDNRRYAVRFSPRRPKSKWTATNLERARRMIEAGKMTWAAVIMHHKDSATTASANPESSS